VLAAADDLDSFTEEGLRFLVAPLRRANLSKCDARRRS
jgi:hypothetical protein